VLPLNFLISIHPPPNNHRHITMRRIPRRSIDLLVEPSRALCTPRIPRVTARPNASPPFLQPLGTTSSAAAAFSSSSVLRARKDKDEPIERTEKVRRWIWGTDEPPGRIDPYDPNSPIRVPKEEQPPTAAAVEPQRRAGPAVSRRAASEPRWASDENYQPADTWEGLETVGGREYQDQLLGELPELHERYVVRSFPPCLDVGIGGVGMLPDGWC
jgi:hypothetical protein